MTRMLAPLFTLLASPALAHSGAHLHPHGSGNWFTLALALALVAVAAALWVRK